jgi:predicted phage terminase large subunit-like protein
MSVRKVAPQVGPQTQFLSTPADIALFGGSAGGGKSYALLMDPLRDVYHPQFAGIIFRKNATHIRKPGALLDQSKGLYPLLGATCRDLEMLWVFPSGAKVKLDHLEHESTPQDYQGAQLPYIGFDELTHFSEHQFWYMISRNRSPYGVRCRVRATCNPDAESWVRKLVDWWVDPKTGYAIPERSGRLRYFVRIEDELVWADTRAELKLRYPHLTAMSFTFIPAKLSDNKILEHHDPRYRAALLSMGRVDRERLLGEPHLGGNWNVRFSAGSYFRRSYFPVVGALTNVQVVRCVRYWDRAGTRVTEESPDPDWTVGVKLAELTTGQWCVMDVVRVRESPKVVEELVLRCAEQDGYDCLIGLEQDPGSAGKADVDNMLYKLAGYQVDITKPTKAKTVRAKPVSAQCERQHVCLLAAHWNDPFLSELEAFGEDSRGHDDQVDAFSGAFNLLTDKQKTLSILDVL